MKKSIATSWSLWMGLAFVSSLVFGYAMFGQGDNSHVFLPGETSHGHYQIEMKCSACHDPDMGVQEDACMRCHAQELEDANDSHPKSKFTDPRNADRLQKLDASRCITCHSEHVADRTHNMGVTVPEDYCFQCHEDVGENRPSHEGMTFDTCATAGCHNYHDNSALYEDFLVKHAEGSDVLDVMKILGREPLKKNDKSLGVAEADFARHGVAPDPHVLEEWSDSVHALAGVSCSDCHDQGGQWVEKPNHESCKACHQAEVEGFFGGHHGMRLAQGLSPMKPSMAKLPMHAGAAHKELSCVSCHGSHGFDREEASVKACMQCHNDDHSNQYLNSQHFQLWAEKGLEGGGVSCATCHMPRIKDSSDKGYRVQHNQNDNLRPNEKMIRGVCMNCHGLEFSIDALADEELVNRNFIGQPSKHVESINMAVERQ